ncbi:alpha-L-rhamnosidase C-terminal domain-containing protein [Amycolatopsis nigrescens]|uniref:alpha-L-rhamnosidase C-terminal domain-containing protein n=1 Tax=Amycolatopsis nigrescens TaxID=381445 RepID=UPI000A034C99|nr:alpha-L-rhamnosidase C-terminal domain-containing protein [Amycolatopsis nigrescens]
MGGLSALPRARRGRVFAVVVVFVSVVGACESEPGGGEAAVELSREAVAADTSWRDRVLDVDGPHVYPRSVTVVSGSAGVREAEGLLRPDGGATTLRREGEDEPVLLVDLGVLTSGYLELGVDGGTDAPIRLAYAEGKEYLDPRTGDGSADPADFFHQGQTPGSDDDPDARADVFAPRGEPATLRSPGLRGAQRYVAVSLDSPGTATIDYLRVRQAQRPASYEGYFRSSDRVLDEAWFASAYGVNLSVAKDSRRNSDAGWIILDGPKRDRIPYVGDLQVVALSGYYQSGGHREPVRNTLALFACQQHPDGSLPVSSRIDVPCGRADPGPPDGSPPGWEPPPITTLARLDSFTAWWVIGLADYHRYAGDPEFVRAMLPVARRAVQFLASRTAGGDLFVTDHYDNRWAINWHPPNTATGIDAYTNAAYYGALRALAGLERSVADDDTAARGLDDRAGRVRDALLARLWDPGAGAMVLNTQDPRRDHTADANIGPLLLGMFDQNQAREAMRFLGTALATPYGTKTSEHPADTNPQDTIHMTQFISPYLLANEALGRFRYGDGTGALRLIRTAWGHMLRTGPGTPWEQIQLDGTAGGAGTSGGSTGLAHAWSTAVPALSAHVLGAEPIADGYRTWRVAPHPVDLRFAQGDVPTPHGTLSVRWQRGEHDTSFRLTAVAPHGTTGTIALPLLGRDRDIALNGHIVWRAGQPAGRFAATREGDHVVFTGLSGATTLAWSS